ncbi:MAG: ATPase [Phycisphaerae bacterium]|nr:ATPase [Phycisphaerae bacterium]
MAVEQPYRLFVQAVSRPEGFLAGTFAGLILVGTLLLSLPIAHTAPEVGFLDTLFTATSAVCVTGLVVLDTAKDYTLFGQTVILVLIQLGGLGIMTFAALARQFAGRRISLRSQVALCDVFYQKNAAVQFRSNLRWIVLLTLTIETIGALLLLLGLPDELGGDRAVFTAVFHAVSAFCNAGFSTLDDSLVGVRHCPGFMATIASLIILGGLGHTVIIEGATRIIRKLRGRQSPVLWSLHTRVVVLTSSSLIVIGAVVIAVLGLGPDSGSQPVAALNAVFQSITARTAGFNSISIGALPTSSLLWMVLLMYIGGSPGSCAGGIKTTSLAVWVARLKARLQHHEDVTIRGRRVPADLVRRTGLLLGVASLYNLIGVMVLSVTEMGRPDCRLEDILFEQISAFSTVGLSTGLTPLLTTAGKAWIILTMFVGRLGPLTVAMIVIEPRTSTVRLPEEPIMIG